MSKTTNPYAIHDAWLAAVNALPDPRPVAALLRSDTPMPDGVRYLLAELFHPGTPPITDWQVVAQTNPEFARTIRKLGVTVNYRRALADGTSARQAAEAAGQQAGVTARQAFRWIQEDTPERLQERLHGSADILALPNVSNKSGGGMVDDSANLLVIGSLSMTG